MKQFIYAQQSDMKLRVIHEKIAVLLEQKLNEAKNDSELLAAIGYHFLIINYFYVFNMNSFQSIIKNIWHHVNWSEEKPQMN